jgi:mannitol/fructose-specific phosphotransferase system IIA component (Ntr-type)
VELGALTRPDLIFPDLPATDSAGVLRELAARVERAGQVRDGDELFRQLWEREQLGSTGIGQGVAIPHCKLKGLRHGVVSIGMVPAGVDFGAVDGQPVKVFFLVISPAESPAEHLQILAALSRWIKAGQHAGRLLALRDPGQVYDLLSGGAD